MPEFIITERDRLGGLPKEGATSLPLTMNSDKNKLLPEANEFPFLITNVTFN